jgi:hypothetical protein
VNRANNLPVHSFKTLLADLGTIAHNEVISTIDGASLVFEKITQPTTVQQKVLNLLGVSGDLYPVKPGGKSFKGLLHLFHAFCQWGNFSVNVQHPG